MIGEQVGSYRITGVLGEGGMGVVYSAEHPVIGQRAAIKILHPKLSTDREVVARLFQEARAAALVKHPGIVNVFDVGHHPLTGAAYIAMELLEGQSLAARIDNQGPLPEAQILRIARQIASALAATHRKGIIHRDLKPDNVFMVPDSEAAGGERAKIVDFGVAKLTAYHGISSKVRTRTGHVVGSPAYMAPEQCKGGTPVDARADVYALGCVLFEMAAGEPPYVGATLGDVIALKLYQPPPRVRERAPGVSAPLEAVIARAMEKRAADRYPSMRHMAKALEEVAAGMGEARDPNFDSALRLAGPAAAPPAPAPPRRGRAGWVVAGLALAGLAVAVLVLARGARASSTLRIDSVPPGAAVYRALDGVRLGETPFARAFDRAPGRLEVVLRLPGYRDEPLAIPTEADGSVMIKLTAVDSSPRTPP